MAKFIGIASGIIVFILWFWLLGRDPVIETAVGAGLAIIAGFGGYYLTRRRWPSRRR